MVHRIGIACGHREALVGQNEEYSAFFEVLRAEGRRTQPIEGRLTEAALAEVDALLIGQPHERFDRTERELLRSWIHGGGSVALLASMGGDAFPGGVTGSSSDMGSLVEGLRFAPGLLYRELGNSSGSEAQLKVPIDVSPLLGRPAILHYDRGCLLGYAPGEGELLDGAPGLAWVDRQLKGKLFSLETEWTDASHLAVNPGATVDLSHGRLAVETHHDLIDIAGADSPFFLRLRLGQGTVVVFGACHSFSNESLGLGDNLLFLDWMLPRWLPQLTAEELHKRQTRPQRHRLLHGYPMAPLLQPRTEAKAAEVEAWESEVTQDSGRPTTIGVLPHPFCNPAVQGCGFCTFPHEMFSKIKSSAVVERVLAEIDRFTVVQPEYRRRPVKGLYFGGGTANLTPPEPFRDLCRKLAQTFDLRSAEVTLEGVPSYFLRWPRLTDILREEIPARHTRISMGLQTFDETQLRRMGRIGFGTPTTFEQVVSQGHEQGLTVSADLMFNLPGQTLDQMKQDLRQAADIGLDQICLYHLVLFEGLGTEWSKDPELVAALPGNDQSCHNWRQLRELLFELGFTQTTLTNFERAEFRDRPDRFLYEECGYCPEVNDLVGFGPSGNSFTADKGFTRAVKRRNPEGAAEYIAAADTEGPVWTHTFDYSPWDLRLAYLTRKLVLFGVDRAAYRSLFGTDLVQDFQLEWEALQQAGLVHIDEAAMQLTPDGMFYADSIAGLLAWRSIKRGQAEARLQGQPRPKRNLQVEVDGNAFFHM